jgi:hypothetical protein
VSLAFTPPLVRAATEALFGCSRSPSCAAERAAELRDAERLPTDTGANDAFESAVGLARALAENDCLKARMFALALRSSRYAKDRALRERAWRGALDFCEGGTSALENCGMPQGPAGCAATASAALRDAARRDDSLVSLAVPLAQALKSGDCVAAGSFVRLLQDVDATGHDPSVSFLKTLSIRSAHAACGESAHPPPEPPDVGAAHLSYRRYCCGDCPTYALTLAGDGRMSFDGHGPAGHVVHEDQISPSDAHELFALIDWLGIARADRLYPCPVSDCCRMGTIEVDLHGGHTTLRDEGGFEARLTGVGAVEDVLHAMVVKRGWAEELKGADNGGP